jgi:hypothetical protein
MQKRKITQQDEAKALQGVLSDERFKITYNIQDGGNFSSLSQFLEESPLKFRHTVEVIVDALHDFPVFSNGYEIDFSSFNGLKNHFETAAKVDLTGSCEGISLTAQQIKTILSSEVLPYCDKSSIFTSMKLCNILDESESAKIFEDLMLENNESEWSKYDKYSFASDSLYCNFNLLTKDMYESLMSNYETSNADGYGDLLLSSAACPRTKDWVKKEYFSNILEDVNSTEWLADEMPLLQEAQNDLFGE